MIKQHILIIDNFDSFVYNILHLLLELDHTVDIFRNNEISIKKIKKLNYDKIVISPGPGNPLSKKDFGISSKVIRKLGMKIPVLGICLGHQGVINAFGGKIIKAKKPMHGKTSMIRHNEKQLFHSIKNPLKVMRYHSLIADERNMPSCLKVTAISLDDNAIMAVKHKKFPVFGLQFHPESIFTEEGKKILKNFCNLKVIQ